MARWRTTRCCCAVALIGTLIAPTAARAQLPAERAPAPTRERPKPSGPLPFFPLQSAWTIALNNSLVAPPGFDETRGFFPIEGDRVVAYDLVSGTRLWIESYATRMTPAAGGGLVFLVLGNGIVALQAVGGSLAWEFPFAEPLAVPLVWDNGWLVVTTKAGSLLALRADDGHLLWRQDLGSVAHARPVLGANRVYAPLEDGRVVALALDDGRILWEHKLGAAANDILPLDDRLFVGSRDNFFYSLKTADGRREWRWRAGADVIGVPVVDEHNVYFVALDNVLRALQRSTGVQQWKRALPLRPTAGPLMAGATLLVSGLLPTLRGYAVKDGTAAGESALPNELAAPAHLLSVPGSPLPLVVVCTQDIAKGATVNAFSRQIEPAIVPPAPLPNLSAKPVPPPADRATP